MKYRNIAAILLSVILIFSGCVNPDTPTPTDTVSTPTESATIPTTQETTEPVYDIPQLPMLSISLPVITDTLVAENGDEIFKLVYQNIAMVTPEPEIADKIIIDFLNQTISVSEDGAKLEADAQAAYHSGEGWTPYLYQHTFAPMRIDSGILSLLGTNATYNGSAHPEVSCVSITYSMVTGDVLSLKDILVPDVSAEDLYRLVIKALESQKDILYEGYEDIVADRFGDNYLQDNSWYLSDNGLCYYFLPREIAGYVSGVITAEIPYSDLVGIIDDSRFPAEQDICTGSVFAVPFDTADLSQYSQFTEITLSENAEKILLYTDGSVRNIRLETGYWNADGSVYTPEFTLLALSTLTPGDAVMIEAPFNSSLPSLRLTYQTDSGSIIEYLSTDFISR